LTLPIACGLNLPVSYARCTPLANQPADDLAVYFLRHGPLTGRGTTSFNSWPDVGKSTQARIFSTSSTALELVQSAETLLLHVYSGMIPSLIQGSAPETVSRTLDATIIKAGHFGSNCNPRQPTKQSVFAPQARQTSNNLIPEAGRDDPEGFTKRSSASES
jgi:hypothetical protein